MNRRIAIIGGGMAGLTSAHLLHPVYNITLFEKSARVGGNAYTLITSAGEEVDIAVAAFGEKSYKNFFELLAKLDIETISIMKINPWVSFGLGLSFSSLDSGKSLYLTPSIKGLLAQNFDQLKPSKLKTILKLKRGLQIARRLSDSGKLKGLTIEEALKKIPCMTGDVKLLFIGGLCWMSSMVCPDVMDAPADFFIEKLRVHEDLLPPKSFYSVKFTKNRTKSYVDALIHDFKDKIILNADIKSVIRENNHILLKMSGGECLPFDQVIFACNADQALSLLEKPTRKETQLLGVWRYTEGKIIVHSDHSRFPRRELMEGYTFLYRDQGRYIETSISGSLWALPGVSRNSDLISTQHPNFPIDKKHIVFEKIFRTPIFDFNSVATIKELPSLNGLNNTYYCGSHFGSGVHEDAVTSAIEIARMLDVKFQK
jgi:predicted NAD/FAD-binding protein